MTTWGPRRLVRTLVPALAVALLILFGLLHLRPARTFALRRVVEIARSSGIDVTAGDLSYNLLTLDIRLHRVSLKAVGIADPFLTADSLRVDLPSAVLRGRLGLEAVEADGLAVTIVRQPDGTLNLPTSSGEGGGTDRFDIGRVTIRDASLGYMDTASEVQLTADRVTLELAPAANGVSSGRIVTHQPLAIRLPGFSTTATLEGLVTYDGESIAMSNVSSTAPIGSLRLDGRVGMFGSSPSLDLTAVLNAQLDVLSSALALDPPLRGTVDISVRAEGPVSAPTATLALSSREVAWQHLSATNLEARATATSSAVALSSLSMRIADGELSGTGSVQLESMHAEGTFEASRVAAALLAGPDVVPAPRASLDGRATFRADLRNGLPGVTMSADIRAASTPGAPGDIDVTGDLSLELSEGAWRLRNAHRVHDAVSVQGDLSGRIGSPVAATTLGGTVTLSANSPDRLLRLLAAVGVSTPQELSLKSGRLDATFAVSGTIDRPEADGRITAADVGLADAAPLEATVSLSANRERITVDDVAAALGGNSLDGSIVLSASGPLQGRFTIAAPDLPSFGPAVANLNPTGRLEMGITVGGTRSAPDVRATLAASMLEVAGQQFDAVNGRLAYANDIVTADSLQIAQPDGGQLRASGNYVPATGTFDVTVQAAGARITPIVTGRDTWPLRATLDGQFSARGTAERPEGTGRLMLTEVRWEDAQVDRAVADIALSPAGLRANVDTPSLSMALDALVQIRAPYPFTATLRANDSALETLRAALGGLAPSSLEPLSGAVRATVQADGTLEDLAAADARIAAERFVASLGNATLRLEGPASASYSASSLTIETLRLRTGATTVDVNGGVGPGMSSDLTATLSGRLEDIEPWVRATTEMADIELRGTVGASIRAGGSMDRLTVEGDARVSDGAIVWTGNPAVESLAASLTLRDGVLEVPSVAARVQDTSLQGTARLPLAIVRDRLPSAIADTIPVSSGPASLSAGITNITPATLAAYSGSAPPDGLTGRASLQIDLSAAGANVDDVSGTLVLTEFQGSSGGLPIGQLRPTRVEVTRGKADIASWTWTVAGSELTVDGSAELAGTRSLDLLANGRVDLRALGVFLPGISTQGTADLAVTVRGTVDEPVADGTIRLSDVEAQVADPRLGITNGRGLVVLGPTRIDVTRIEAIANGGRVSIAGALDYAGAALTGGQLSVDANGVGLEVPDGMRTELDAALAIRLAGRIQVSGRVDIAQGAYREPISLAATLASMARQREAARVSSAAPSAASQVDLDIVVASATDLQIDNNYGRMDLGVDLRLVGTAAAPSVVGRATFRDGGLLYLGGQTYVIDRGTIDFSDPRIIVPDLDLAARTRVNGVDETGAATEYDITLAISGTPDTLETTLSSDPARSQADIVSLLATGRLADQVGGMGGDLARDQILGYLSGEALGFAARAVGLDSIRLERRAGQDLALQTDPSIAGEVNPAQRLTLARRVSGGVEVTLSQNLRDTGRQTWVVSYKPIRPVEVRGISRDDRSRSYELRHDVSLGGPKPVATVRPEQVTPRITAVRFIGETIVPIGELEGATSLDAGDRFDFRTWQRDRDRLRAMYVQRGYREVRISARQLRQESEPSRPTVTLEYQIAPGPRTFIDVEGYALSSGALGRLHDIWSDTIVDVALADDLASATRRLLAEDGFFAPEVRAERGVTSESEKHITLNIVAGRRSRSRSLSIDGAARLREEEIERIAERLGIDAWLMPRLLSDEVALLYRERGLLASVVSAGPVIADPDAAVLPVYIAEGPQFTIGRVTVRGTRQRSADDVRGDLGLQEGGPYLPADLDRGRASVAAGYARAGFNAASAVIEPVIDREAARVALDVSIEEGPRQLLQDVAISGGEGVRAGVVAGALDLTPGTPVDLEAWYAGRRRLSQTGLFRRIDLTPTTVRDAGVPEGIELVRAEVALVRRQPWRIRYGVDVSDEAAPVASQGRVFGGGLNANIERFGLFGGPGSGSAALRYSRTQRSARGGVSWPSLFGQPLASRLYLGRTRDLVEGENILSFISDRNSVTAEQRLSMGARTLVAWAYQFELNHVFDPNGDPDDPFAIDERWRQSRVTASLAYDTRTNPFDPASGQFHSSNVEYGLEVLGRSGRFVTYSLQELVFVPLPRRVVSASGVRLNMGRGFGGQDLIMSERFYAGGANTVRGYPDNALGGYDFFGDPIPGQAALVLNEEIRFPLYRWVRGTAFVDAGNVFAQPADLALGSLKVGAGAGLRFSTPLGLFRLDVASPLSDQDKAPRWYFAFGHIF